MPFDPLPTHETKTDPFSLDGLITWLETMPAEGEYDWGAHPMDGPGCLIHQYLSAREKDPILDYGQFANCAGPYRAADTRVVMPRPWTFGAALARARALRDAS